VDFLWSPWRLDYVTNVDRKQADKCVFCDAVAPSSLSPLLIFRAEAVYVILNKFPYNNGHLMIVPKRHIGTVTQATRHEQHELIELVSMAEVALTEAYRPHGINVGINMGRSAGAGVPGHLHVHLVPRWDGDTNFMSVVGSTRVVPEEPAKSVERLRPIFERLKESS